MQKKDRLAPLFLSLILTALCLAPPVVSQGAQQLEMPQMPAMPSMPDMPNTDEPMAGRKAFEAMKNRQAASSSAQSTAKKPVKGTESTAGVAGVDAPSPSSPPAPSSTSPISSFGSSLQVYADIDELLQRLSAQKETGVQSSRPAGEVLPDARAAPASILRFVINGSDIRAAIRNVHFSKVEADGSFLLTAERRYWAGGAQKIESFYMLFTASSSGGAGRYYDVTCSVVQDGENDASYLSRIASEGGLTATKTGNLVTLKVNGEGINADLLLDIGQ